jgi:hypothetical protein
LALKKTAEAKSASVFREIDRCVAAIILYPISSKEEAKNAAMENLVKIYTKGNDAIRQHFLSVIQENIFYDMKVNQTYDYCRTKNPKVSPIAIKSSVLHGMFDYNSSTEGIAELIGLLGELNGHEAAKLLTRLFSHFCSVNSEADRMLRNAIIEALGDSNSSYSLNALITYARLTDNDTLFGRLVSSLAVWSEKIDSLDLPAEKKLELKEELKFLMAKEEKPTQYG